MERGGGPYAYPPALGKVEKLELEYKSIKIKEMRTISTPLGQVELKVKCKVYEVYQARAKSKVKLESFRFLN